MFIFRVRVNALVRNTYQAIGGAIRGINGSFYLYYNGRGVMRITGCERFSMVPQVIKVFREIIVINSAFTIMNLS